MALAVTHILITIVLLDLLRHYVFGKRRFPRYMLVVGGIAGILPDIDIPLTWVYNAITGSTGSLHGFFTHSLIFPLLFVIVGLAFHFYKPNHKWAKMGYIIAFGLFMHLLLDCAFGGYKSFLWPLENIANFCPQWSISKFAADIDAIILIVWLVHEEVHNRIRDYI